MYIAIKNTENKGVYRKTEFKYEWLTPGTSMKRFRNSKLNEALAWAGVKEVKGITDEENTGRKKKYKKNNRDLILSIRGINRKHVKSLNNILAEIEDESNRFTKTPFYLNSELYISEINGIVDDFELESVISLCKNAINYLNGVIEDVKKLDEELKEKEKEFDSYQLYLEWKNTPEGIEYSKDLKSKIYDVVKDREYKDKIVLFIKTYNKNKKHYNKSKK